MDALYVKQLYNKLTSELKTLSIEISNIIPRHSAMTMKSKSYVNKLREHIISEKFKSQKEEIDFFKNIKPKFSALVYFHEKVYTIESNMPHGTAEQKSMYLSSVVAKINNFYINNTSFSTYMKKGSTTNDATYIVIGNGQMTLGLGFDYLDIDPQFSSIHSSLVARFIGAEMALEYVSKRIASLEGFETSYVENPHLDYNGTNTELIELAYACHKSGRVKNDIIQIISVFEKVFNTTIKEAYRTYYDFKSRKTDRTKFLSFLKKELNNALDRES